MPADRGVGKTGTDDPDVVTIRVDYHGYNAEPVETEIEKAAFLLTSIYGCVVQVQGPGVSASHLGQFRKRKA